MLSRSTEVRKDVSVSSVVVERAGDEGVSVSVLGRRGIGGGGT
jgi:post-segregation antitoxin (ccd killing protein)